MLSFGRSEEGWGVESLDTELLTARGSSKHLGWGVGGEIKQDRPRRKCLGGLISEEEEDDITNSRWVSKSVWVPVQGQERGAGAGGKSSSASPLDAGKGLGAV